jgi:tRNA pseudouridine55 synthase
MLDQDFAEGATLLIDKPYKWTSFDVVGYFKKIVGVKVGHAGTLDPLATGLLVIYTGKRTKELPALQADEKEYTGTFLLGASTPSFDLETEIDDTKPVSHINNDEIIKIFKEFEGKQNQIAPIFSAKHIDGERSYLKARRGESVDIKPVEIEIKEFELIEVINYENTIEVKFRVLCTKGTYIRGLARDVALKLDTVGHLSSLRRIRSGIFRIEDAITIDDIKKKFNYESRKRKD